jgi:hypothetical protein
MLTLDTLRQSFTARMPYLRRMARSKFRGLPPEAREEAIANTLALAWTFIYRLFLRGRAEEPNMLNSCLWYACKQTKQGRTPQGCPRAKDVFNLRRFGKARFEQLDADQFVGRNTPVFDQVSFRIDVPAFFATLNARQRRMALDLAGGMTTGETAEKYGLSAGRISQFRREFKDLFDQFFAV